MIPDLVGMAELFARPLVFTGPHGVAGRLEKRKYSRQFTILPGILSDRNPQGVK
jgi:hypothetical protein